jgi:hypothetical protein
MRGFTLGCVVVALAACGGARDQAPPADTTAVVAPPPPAPVSLSTFAGRWHVVARNEATGDSLVAYDLTATADTSGWTITFPGRPAPVPVRVALVGNEVSMEAGPYESAVRKGVQVSTQGTVRIEGDSLVGSTTARYKTTSADSVVRIRMVGKRMP